MKRIMISAMLVAVLLWGGAGCMSNDLTQSQPAGRGPADNINNVALAYMEQKYGEAFEYSGPYGNSMTGTHQLLVTCGSFPGETILVRIENYRREDKVFLDNYMAVKYRSETYEFLLDCAKEVFGEATVFYEVTHQALSPELAADATFEEFLADTRVPMNIAVEVKAGAFTAEHQARQLAELIAKNGTAYYLSLVFVHDGDYGLYDSEALDKQVAAGNYAHCAIITRLDGEIRAKWLEKE